MNKIKIFKDNTRIAVKLFIMVWVVLLVHVLLKVTFNYWQPYVIPNEQLQAISDFIDNHKILIIILDSLFYIFNGIVMILCSIQSWWFKNLKQSIIVIFVVVLSYVYLIIFGQSTILSLTLNFAIPLIINYRKWLYTILAFVFSNVFLALSLFLEGFTNANDMPYVISVFLALDYYIMLLLNYFLFNLRRKKEVENGK